jgi:hypothetical protein
MNNAIRMSSKQTVVVLFVFFVCIFSYLAYCKYSDNLIKQYRIEIDTKHYQMLNELTQKLIELSEENQRITKELIRNNNLQLPHNVL